MKSENRLFASFALVLALVAGTALATPVDPFTATYEVRRNGAVLGEATLRLEREGGAWRFGSATRGTQGLARVAGVRVDETSRFRYVGGKPETIEYRFAQKTSFNERSRAALVEPEAGRVTLHNREERAEAPYVRGVVDRQLVTIALMQAIAAGRQGEVMLHVAGRAAIEPQAWVIGRKERVAGMDGEAWRVERRRDDGEGRSTVLWLSASGSPLPLRIEQREDDGETVEMRLLRRG